MLSLKLPHWTESRVESAEFCEVVPTEYRADLVVLLLDGTPLFAIVVEVQPSRDEDKRKRWAPPSPRRSWRRWWALMPTASASTLT
jgi:hypothetical protein